MGSRQRNGAEAMKNAVRNAEVKREFGIGTPDEWHPSEHAKYAAPWRDLLGVDNETGVVQYSPYYGPHTEAQYRAQVERYELSLGWWDETQDAPRRAAAGVARAARGTNDAVIMAWVRHNPERVTGLHRAVVYAYFEDGAGYGTVARRLGVETHQVRDIVRDVVSKATNGVVRSKAKDKGQGRAA